MPMDPNRVQAVFLLAVEATDATARAQVLERECGADAELRQRVEVLLFAHDATGAFLDKQPVSPVSTGDEPPLTEAPGARIGPYKLLQQIGEGGMGAVFLAEQTEPVQRKVALKVIKAGMDTRQVIARFEAERQALALMDHPNIAKVLDGGATDSGRPYFVMELVKGVPITKYCDENRLTPKQRLELFVPVCRAIQHAHQKGIIHRDVKPSNVLIALYDGKPVPKVIDFGIAKATGQKLTDKTVYTDFGAVVGTLEYMSPEQAESNELDIDTRADVYALGVLLYELLTGTTPLERKRLRSAATLECLRIIREEEPPKPSTRLSTAEELPSIAAKRGLEPKKLSGQLRGDLDWIAMKCLEKDRNRRYETANGLATDVQRHLADEPVLASPPSATYRLSKFARRHKAGLWTTAAALAVVLLVSGSVGWVLWDQAVQRADVAGRIAETEKAVTLALSRADGSAVRAGRQRSSTRVEALAALADWREAQAALAEAEAALTAGTATAALRERVATTHQRIEAGHEQEKRKEKLFRDLDEARMANSVWVGNRFDNDAAAKKYAAAFKDYGLDVTRKDETTQRITEAEPEVRDVLIVALDDWYYDSLEPALLALAQAADNHPWRQRFRAAVDAKDRALLRASSVEARQSKLPASSLVLLARTLWDAGEYEESLAVLRSSRDRHPTDFWLHFELGTRLQMAKGSTPLELEEAMGCFHAALALRPEASAAHINLGNGLHAKKQFDQAIAEYQKAIELDITIPRAHRNLGLALMGKKQVDEAIPEFRRAIQLDANYASAHSDLGGALRLKHQYDEAITEFNKAIALDSQDAPRDAGSHNSLGVVLLDLKRLDEAIVEFEKAIKIDANNAVAYANIGVVLKDQNKSDEAIAKYRKAIQIDPKYAEAHYDLGLALADNNLLDDAILEYRKAIQLDGKHALAHFHLAKALKAKNQLDDAIAEYRIAMEIDPKYALAHNNLGNILLAKNRLDEAAAEYQKAIELNDTDPAPHNGLGTILLHKKSLDEAVAEYQKAIKIDASYAPAYTNLCAAYAAKNQWDEAIVVCRKIIEIDPKNATAYYNLGKCLEAKNQLDKAVAAYEKAIDLQPDYAEAHCNLASVHRSQGRFAAALKSYKRGDELGSKRQDWHYPSKEWVADAERLVQLEAKLPDILALKAKPADIRESLGFIEVCELQHRYVAAVRLIADAFTAEGKLADDLQSGRRYNAACYAALAAAGQGTDADKLDDKERTRLRKQALDWLRADLDLWTKRLVDAKPSDLQGMIKTLKHWQEDTDLVGIRDKDAVAKLSAEEREACQKLWADVAEVLKKATDGK